MQELIDRLVKEAGVTPKITIEKAVIVRRVNTTNLFICKILIITSEQG